MNNKNNEYIQDWQNSSPLLYHVLRSALFRNRLTFIYTSKTYLAAVVFANSLLILNWMCMIYFSLWPYDEFLSISKEVWPDGSVNVTGRCYIAISNRVSGCCLYCGYTEGSA